MPVFDSTWLVRSYSNSDIVNVESMGVSECMIKNSIVFGVYGSIFSGGVLFVYYAFLSS